MPALLLLQIAPSVTREGAYRWPWRGHEREADGADRRHFSRRLVAASPTLWHSGNLCRFVRRTLETVASNPARSLMEPFTFTPGRVPLLVSMPHPGTYVPDAVANRFTTEARTLPDTDWHLPRLYDFVAAMGASVLIATHSRYVIDLNRAPDGTPLYPGASNSELCPLTLFSEAAIYLPGREPDEREIDTRRRTVWEPYHRRLADELQRLRATHGIALLFDAHSIKSEVPRFFSGRLPDLNLGTADGASADPELASRLLAVCASNGGYTSVLDGRFKGGYITRHYGRPSAAIHAVQLEIAERIYMDEAPPFRFDEPLAESLRPLLRSFIAAMLAWADGARP